MLDVDLSVSHKSGLAAASEIDRLPGGQAGEEGLAARAAAGGTRARRCEASRLLGARGPPNEPTKLCH